MLSAYVRCTRTIGHCSGINGWVNISLQFVSRLVLGPLHSSSTHSQMLSLGSLYISLVFLASHITLMTFFVCTPSLLECQKKLDTILHVFSILGIPIADDKLESPFQVISLLGIEIDSLNFTIRLPSDKLSDLSSSAVIWRSRKKCLKSQLLSLIGSLSFAC